MKTKLLWIVCTSISLFFVGCVKDRTLEDWRSEHDAQIRQQVRDVSGDYRGSLALDALGLGLGSAAFELHLEQCTQLGSPSGNQVASQTAVCGTLRIPGMQPIAIGFQNGAFDFARNEFRAQVQVPGRGMVSIEGVVSNQALSGKVMMEGYPDHSGHFQLEKDAALSVADGASIVRQRNGSLSGFQFYSGNPHFTDGGVDGSVKMAVMRPLLVQEQEFADLFIPIRYVDVSFNLGHQVDVVFHRAVWDRRTGTLMGEASSESASGSSAYGLQLTCHEVAKDSIQGWNCQYVSLVNRAGLIFIGSFWPESLGAE